METKDIVIDQELLIKAAKVKKGQSLADSYKWYIHLEYIKYIEGVAHFLMRASEVENEYDVVCIQKSELIDLANTLLQTKTYNREAPDYDGACQYCGSTDYVRTVCVDCECKM